MWAVYPLPKAGFKVPSSWARIYTNEAACGASTFSFLKNEDYAKIIPNNSQELEMVDELDIKLIQKLQKNGWQSYVDLAEMMGLTEGAIRRRINQLLFKNLIKIVALPNLHQLGYKSISIMGMQVKMVDLKRVAENLAKKPNVCYLSFVTGRYDLMAIIISRSTKELSRFIEEEIAAIPSILRTETFVNLDILKGGWPELDTTQLISSLDLFSLNSHEE